MAGLERLPVNPEEAPYAVWVFGSEREDEAEAVAANLALDTREARVIPWKSGSPKHYDVFVLGFRRFAEAEVNLVAALARVAGAAVDLSGEATAI